MKYLIIILVLILLFVLFVVIESIRECRKFKITNYTLDDIEDESFAGLKIAFFADLHNTWFDEDNSSLIKAIRDYKPDAIILGGDMLVCRVKQIENNLKTAHFINKLCDIAPVYYGMGNHETGVKYKYDDVGDNWEDYLKLLDPRITILNDENVKIRKEKITFSVYGLALRGKYYSRLKTLPLTKEDMKEKLGDLDTSNYNILIAHNPDYFKVYAKWGADLVLSGHNHGGLVRLPILGGVISPRLHLFPKYTYGVYKNEDSKMILTNGLGAHSMKIRVGNVPELVFININRK